MECAGNIPEVYTNKGTECGCDLNHYIDGNNLRCVSCWTSEILGDCLECSDQEDKCFRCAYGYYLTIDNKCVKDSCDFEVEGSCLSCNRDNTGNALIP